MIQVSERPKDHCWRPNSPRLKSANPTPPPPPLEKERKLGTSRAHLVGSQISALLQRIAPGSCGTAIEVQVPASPCQQRSAIGFTHIRTASYAPLRRLAYSAAARPRATSMRSLNKPSFTSNKHISFALNFKIRPNIYAHLNTIKHYPIEARFKHIYSNRE